MKQKKKKTSKTKITNLKIFYLKFFIQNTICIFNNLIILNILDH